MKRPARVPSQLPESLHKRLSAYALAASATGVGVLALAKPVTARVVYTPADVTLGYQQGQNYQIALDLNHDGINDFSLNNYLSIFAVDVLSVSPNNQGNSAMGTFLFASCLPPGFIIGRLGNFEPNKKRLLDASSSGVLGQWKNATNRYLGLKFLIAGKIHYGWARLTVQSPHFIVATLTGYAYETIPNKPIIAGKAHGGDEATLGRLAQGASGAVSLDKK